MRQRLSFTTTPSRMTCCGRCCRGAMLVSRRREGRLPRGQVAPEPSCQDGVAKGHDVSALNKAVRQAGAKGEERQPGSRVEAEQRQERHVGAADGAASRTALGDLL